MQLRIGTPVFSVTAMIISSDHFEAYLNCTSKCWFRSHGVKTISNPYSQYVQRQKQSCRAEIIKRLLDNENQGDTIASPSHPLTLKRSKWRHLRRVDAFFGELGRSDYQSEVAIKCKERLDKNRDKLLTFLKFDGVPWNNNNAEHAIKAFAGLRDVIAGTSTEKGIE